VEFWIQFGRGPLFAVAFSLMVLGVARILVLTMVGVIEAYRRSWDRIVNWKEVGRQTVRWLVPVGRLWRSRPVYSTLSLLFHVGLLVVPLFAGAHVLLWRRWVGFAWKAMTQSAADVLTIVTLVAGAGLLLGRAASAAARSISRPQEYLWPLLLLVPFATGFACSHAAFSPKAYQSFMLLHVYTADLILALIPFTKIAHCVLTPLSQIVTAVAWKFPPGAGDRVAATLGYANCPSWVLKARLTKAAHAVAPAAVKTATERVEVKLAQQEGTAQ
jgi:nitrate reductase gamma subunit